MQNYCRILVQRPQVALAFLSIGLWAVGVLDSAAASSAAEKHRFFEQSIRPMLAENCFKCHGPDTQKGDLRLDSRERMLEGGGNGPAVTPGKPTESLLMVAVSYRDEDLQMPPKKSLAKKQVALLEKWIEMGAPWPGSATDVVKPAKISEEDRQWWAFQPPLKPDVPKIEGDSWSRNEIDRFILARLKSEGLTPATQAEKRQLIRRVFFDLTGLPPTPGDVENFLADESESAYPSLIERLLDSPQYGERWGRHWLDVVRYAESDGFRADDYRPNAWRYRDYVIRSFNENKPYDQFVREQLAGDEIAPDDPDVTVATGFLRHGIYEWNQRDAETQWSDILNEMTDITSDVFLGLGMSCARCHDHKFDPILQKDYFKLQAFLAPTLWTIDTPLATSGQLAEHERAMAVWEAKAQPLLDQIEAIEEKHRAAARESATKIFPPEVQAMVRKPEAEQGPYERQMNYLVHRQVLVAWKRISGRIKGDEKKKWDALKLELAKLEKDKPKPLPVGMTVTDVGATAPKVVIPGKRDGAEIAPGFLTVLGDESPKIEPIPAGGRTTGRRTALAKWITRPDHPLTARVMVNRVWQRHFGRGIVANASDYGRLGEKPTHPELLDWLAATFVEKGWRIKEMHRLILNSATYRQTAMRTAPEVARMKDPGNRWLWRMNTSRLGAEQIRDAMLAASGELDLKAGGAGVSGETPRRSVYVKVFRNKLDPLLQAFDFVNGLSSTPKRNVTTTATQSLLMINGDWILKRATAMAKRLERDFKDSPAKRIDAAYAQAFGRLPALAERDAAMAFVGAQADGIVNAKPEPALAAATAKIDKVEGGAALLKPGSSQEFLEVPHSESIPTGDFTVEAIIKLDSMYPDATVRTVVSQWNSASKSRGWSLGVTSAKSGYQPRNLILQLIGDTAKGDSGYEVIASNLRPELGKPYYIAVSVKLADLGEGGTTFYMKDLSDPKAKLTAAFVAHRKNRHYASKLPILIGGRAGSKTYRWDGAIGDVRISNAALERADLMIYQDKARTDTIGFWRFEEKPGFYSDSSKSGNGIKPPAPPKPTFAAAKRSALVDFCHVLLNSNEFLYVD